jgi:hypothetical protein
MDEDYDEYLDSLEENYWETLEDLEDDEELISLNEENL